MVAATKRCCFGIAVLWIATSGCKGLRGGSPSGDAAAVDAAPPDAVASSTVDATPADDSIPPTSSDELTARARHLVEALAADDPDLAMDILFPRDGWLATRDAEDPGKDWDKVVERPFQRSVHAVARRAERAQFVSLELGHAVVQETTRHHGWKKSLWSVHGSQLTYVVDGHTRTLHIREMTAWRGAWYVTRIR
jgi:hypothetical protein